MTKGFWRAGLVGVVVLVMGCSELDRHGMRTQYHPLADEAYVRLAIEDRSEMDWLTRQVSIDRARDGQVWIYASSAQLADLARQGYAWEGLPHPGVNPDAPMGFFDKDGNKQWDHFPTYAEYVAAMHQYANDYPDLCRLHDLGPTNNQSRPHSLLVLEITDNPDLDEDEPEVLYT